MHWKDNLIMPLNIGSESILMFTLVSFGISAEILNIGSESILMFTLVSFGISAEIFNYQSFYSKIPLPITNFKHLFHNCYKEQHKQYKILIQSFLRPKFHWRLHFTLVQKKTLFWNICIASVSCSFKLTREENQNKIKSSYC